MSSEKSTQGLRDPATATYWRLLAISLDPDRSEPELYGLMHEGETDVPLMVDGRIVFFTDPARAHELIQKHGAALPANEIDVAKPFFWCDVAQALYYLSSGGMDTDASVLGAVNALLDLVRASGATIDDRRRHALHAIADYCTVEKDLTKYFEQDGDYSSDELVDAVLWCVGAVVVKARIL
ncbi:MAG TPA: hypothetical protein VFK02_16185 [Kofleriaceae bacterium]|nr:hypothetical protein [Kofleriaceae bacterium]